MPRDTVRRLPVGIRKVKKHAGGASGAVSYKATFHTTSCTSCHQEYAVERGRRSPPCPKCQALQPEQVGWL